MVQSQTVLRVFDNSGVKTIKCIRVCRGQNAGWNSLVLVSVKQLRSINKIKLKVKKGSVMFAYVLKAKAPLKRLNGLRLKAGLNGAILLNKQLQPFSSRVFGLVPKELRNNKFLKLIILSGTTV